MFVETPVKLTAEQKALITQFGELSGGQNSPHHPKTKSFFDKVKGFFSAE